MRSWRLWLLCFALWDTSSTVTAVSVYKKPQGAHLTVRCPSSINLPVTRRVFSKNDCEEGEILVQTSESVQTKGRYRIRHEKKGSPPLDFIYVGISNLRLSDSGRYRCFWDRPEQSSYSEFRIEVTDDADEESKTVAPIIAGEDFSQFCHFSKPGKKKSFCRNVCSEEDILVMTSRDEGQSGRYKIQYQKYAEDLSYVTVMIRDVNMADSGAYQCRLDEDSKDIWISVAPAPPSDVPVAEYPEHPGESSNTQILTMILIVVPVCVVLIAASILTIYCMRRTVTDRRTGGDGGQNPQSDYVNAPPNAPEVIYEELCLEEMDPVYDQLQLNQV